MLKRFAALLIFLSAPLIAQEPSAVLRTDITERGTEARARVISALLAEGVPVGSVAACECLISSGIFEMKVGMMSSRTLAQIDVSLVQTPSGTSVALTIRRSSAPTFWDPATLVSADTTRRMPDEDRRVARLLHAVASRLR